MATKAGFMERRDSVHGECVYMEALQGTSERTLLDTNTHVLCIVCMWYIYEERPILSLPERWGFSGAAVCLGRRRHEEEFCPTRSLRGRMRRYTMRGFRRYTATLMANQSHPLSIVMLRWLIWIHVYLFFQGHSNLKHQTKWTTQTQGLVGYCRARVNNFYMQSFQSQPNFNPDYKNVTFKSLKTVA